MMLSGSPLYGAGCLGPGSGDLVNKLPPQATAALGLPLSPAGHRARASGCCWRRAPLHPPQDQASVWGGRPAGRLSGERLEGGGGGGGGGDAKRPTLLGGDPANAGPMVEAEGGSCHGGGPTTEAEGGPCHGAGPKAMAEGGPCQGGGPAVDAEGGACCGGGPMAEAEGGLCHESGPTTEAEGGPCHGSGPTAEAEGGPCYGGGPTVEAEGRPCCGGGPTVEAEGGPSLGAGPKAEAEGGPCHGSVPTAEAEGGPCHGAGPTAEGRSCHGTGPTAEGEPCHGVGHKAEVEDGPSHGAGKTAEAEGGPCHRGSPSVEAEDGCCHGVGHTVDAEGEPYHGAGSTAEAEGEPHHRAGQRQGGSSEDNEIRARKDGAFKELTEPQKQQCRCQNIQAGKGRPTTVTDLSETHPRPAWERTEPPSTVGLLPAGPVTMTTAAVEVQAQTGENVGASDRGEPQEAEEQDEEFGIFEKAGNPIQWAEFTGPLWPEGEDLYGRSGSTAGRSPEAGEDVAAEPDSGGTVQRRASLHGSSSRAVGSRESESPLVGATLSHALTADGGGRPFRTADSQSQGSTFDAFSLNQRETARRAVGGVWWSTGALEHHTSPSGASLDNGELQSVFRSCFPAVSPAGSSRAIPPLGQLLGRSKEKGGEGFLSAQARDLWALLRDVDEAVGLKYRWTESQGRKLLLAALRVDQASADTSAGHTRTLGSSPLCSGETRRELHPTLASSDRDSKDLMLIKDTVPQHPTNGFSPTHRLQAFFHHWTQADRNGKSKTPYDVNKNFMA